MSFCPSSFGNYVVAIETKIRLGFLAQRGKGLYGQKSLCNAFCTNIKVEYQINTCRANRRKRATNDVSADFVVRVVNVT